MNENGSFKKKKVYFSQVSNNALRDKHLSLKAKGLYALIQSYITLEDFVLYKNTLRKQCIEGEKAFESTWRELKEKGYLLQAKHKKLDGTFYYEYDLLDISQHADNHPIENHPAEKEGMDDGGSGKGGIYNNTDSNNTNLNNTNNKDIYINFPIDAHPFFFIYNNAFKDKFKKEHMRLKENQLEDLKSWINELTDIVENEEFEEAVVEHFETLPSSNNGNMLAFMKASKRYFELTPENYVKNEPRKNKVIKGNFNNFPQRNYDFDKLEKGLLGWDKQEG